MSECAYSGYTVKLGQLFIIEKREVYEVYYLFLYGSVFLRLSIFKYHKKSVVDIPLWCSESIIKATKEEEEVLIRKWYFGQLRTIDWQVFT